MSGHKYEIMTVPDITNINIRYSSLEFNQWFKTVNQAHDWLIAHDYMKLECTNIYWKKTIGVVAIAYICQVF